MPSRGVGIRHLADRDDQERWREERSQCTRPWWPVVRAPSSRQLLSGSRPDANMLIPLRWPFHWLPPTPVDTRQIDFPITPLRLKTTAVNMELPLRWWEQKQPFADCLPALDVTASWCTAGSRRSQLRVPITIASQWLDMMVKSTGGKVSSSIFKWAQHKGIKEHDWKQFKTKNWVTRFHLLSTVCVHDYRRAIWCVRPALSFKVVYFTWVKGQRPPLICG